MPKKRPCKKVKDTSLLEVEACILLVQYDLTFFINTNILYIKECDDHDNKIKTLWWFYYKFI